MKLFICGHAQHGKDTAAEFIKQFTGMTFSSSSLFCCKLFITNTLGYNSTVDCYNDRFNHRKQWHDLIRAFNKGDEGRLSRAIFLKNDIYVGIRAKEEVVAARREKIVDAMIWIDASDRIGVEDNSSISITRDMADIVIENNGSKKELLIKIDRFCSILKKD